MESLYSSFAYANAMDVQIPMPSVSTAEVGGSTSGWTSTYDMKFQVMDNKCAGYSEMLAAQINETKEMFAVITSDNKVVVLPSSGNTKYTFNFTMNNLYTDLLGRPLVYVDADKKEVTVYYYQAPDTKPTAVSTFSITGFVHSHPIDDDTYWNDPSPEDKTMATNNPTFDHYFVNRLYLVKYNGSGIIPGSEGVKPYSMLCPGY